jgi:hypothetical protein
VFFAGVVDTGDKLITGVTILVLIITGVVDIGEQALSRIFIVSMTPDINSSHRYRRKIITGNNNNSDN